jgi:hypothetical protein
MKIVFFIKIKFIRFSNLFLHMLEHWIVVLCGFVKIQNGLNCFENGFEKAIKQKKKKLSFFLWHEARPTTLSLTLPQAQLDTSPLLLLLPSSLAWARPILRQSSTQHVCPLILSNLRARGPSSTD